MPSFSPARAHRTSARLVACLLVVLGLFATRSVSAAILVPMCGEHAETIAAPPIQRATNNGVLRAAPCESTGQAQLHDTRSAPPRPELVSGLELVPRLPPVTHDLPSAPAPARLDIERVASGERSAFARNIERPPR